MDGSSALGDTQINFVLKRSCIKNSLVLDGSVDGEVDGWSLEGESVGSTDGWSVEGAAEGRAEGWSLEGD